MGAKTYTMGPGSLVFGETASELEISCQITEGKISWSVDSEDDTPLLCGDVESGADDFTANLEATLYQDLGDDGIVEWSWTKKGQVVPFVFIPSTAAGKQITGSVKVRPLDVGGTPKTKPTSDIDWPCVGEPELEAIAGD